MTPVGSEANSLNLRRQRGSAQGGKLGGREKRAKDVCQGVWKARKTTTRG